MAEYSDDNNLHEILGQISRLEFGSPNFRSQNNQHEFPVDNSDEDTAINRFVTRRTAERAAEQERHAKDKQLSTAEDVLRRRARRAQASADGINGGFLPQSVIDYLSTVTAALVAHADAISIISSNVIEIIEKVDALEESVAEAKPKPTVNITLDAALFGDDVAAMGELLDELETRVERIKRRRAETGR